MLSLLHLRSSIFFTYSLIQPLYSNQTQNIDETLVNGSIGRVLSFQTASEYQDYRRGLLVAKSSDTADSKAITTATTAPETGKKVAKAEKDWLKWPIVSFSIPGGGKREVQVVQETFKVESPSGEVQASRMQVRTPSFLSDMM